MHRSAAVKIAKDFKEIHDESIEGVLCQLIDPADVFKWKIWIQGPGDSPYDSGIFQASMTFPHEYPMYPPALKIDSEFWHPNVFPDGRVCISILHPPGNDPHGDERPEERWLPTQTVATILLSFLSLLSDPNIFSPANVDASVEWRDNREAYIARCKKLVEKANKIVPLKIRDNMPHPDSNPQERQKRIDKQKASEVVEHFNLWGDDEEDPEGDLIDFDEEEDANEESGGDIDDCSTETPPYDQGVKRKREATPPRDEILTKKKKGDHEQKSHETPALKEMNEQQS